MKKLVGLMCVLLLSACSTFTPPRYGINADTNVVLRTSGINGVGIGQISGPAQFDSSCRGAGPVAMPDGMTIGEYIQKALTDEMKIAGTYAEQDRRVTLSGTVDKAAFSSAWGGSSWDLALTLTSSNGKRMSASELYEFKGSYVAETACSNVANAFMPAVQNLIQKIVRSPEFKGLVE